MKHKKKFGVCDKKNLWIQKTTYEPNKSIIFLIILNEGVLNWKTHLRWLAASTKRGCLYEMLRITENL